MRKRLLGGGAAAALVVSSLAMGMAPAMADPSFTPDANDIVGVGSDTIEFVVNDLAGGYNATLSGADPAKLASWNATGPSGETWKPRAGAQSYTRPNGSGAGKKALYGATEIPEVNFARASSSESTDEANAGLVSYPFAVDGLEAGVSGSVASHAPASISRAVLLKIYDGTYKQWGDIPGYSGGFPNSYIHPKVPQSGSGTRNFFEAQLVAERGAAPTWSSSDYGQPSGSYPGVVEVQEHDPAQIMNDPDAIAPFSTARQHTLANPASIHLEDGWSAQRAVYDVVRGTDAGASWVAALFGPNGYFCSSAGRTYIADNGFAQLASQADGGACGVSTTTSTTNLTTNTVSTTTTLTGVSNAAHQATLTGVVGGTGATAADGDIDFYEGATKVGTALVSAGQATATITGLTAGAHDFTARFVSGNTAAFANSQTASATTVAVKKSSTTTVAVPATGVFGHARRATASVTDEGGAPSTGVVRFAVGAWAVNVPLTNGAAAANVPATIGGGRRFLVATYLGTGSVGSSVVATPFTVARSGVVLRETFPAKVKKRKKAHGTVLVSLSPGSSVRPSGVFVIKRGAKVLSVASLSGGARAVVLPKLKKGKNTLTLTFLGNANEAAKSLVFTIKQK